MVCKLPTADIYYIEYHNRRADFFTDGASYYSYGVQQEIEERLGDNFFKCCKTLILNLDYVSRVDDFSVIFSNGATVYLNKKCVIRIKQRFAGYLAQKKYI